MIEWNISNIQTVVMDVSWQNQLPKSSLLLAKKAQRCLVRWGSGVSAYVPCLHDSLSYGPGHGQISGKHTTTNQWQILARAPNDSLVFSWQICQS